MGPADTFGRDLPVTVLVLYCITMYIGPVGLIVIGSNAIKINWESPFQVVPSPPRDQFSTGYKPGIALTTTYITMATSTTYASKYGTITLLNRTNYTTWKLDISTVLLAANALDIVLGESIAPSNLAS